MSHLRSGVATTIPLCGGTVHHPWGDGDNAITSARRTNQELRRVGSWPVKPVGRCRAYVVAAGEFNSNLPAPTGRSTFENAPLAIQVEVEPSVIRGSRRLQARHNSIPRALHCRRDGLSACCDGRRSVSQECGGQFPRGRPISHSCPDGSMIRPMRQPCSSATWEPTAAPADTACRKIASGSCTTRSILLVAPPAPTGLNLPIAWLVAPTQNAASPTAICATMSAPSPTWWSTALQTQPGKRRLQ